MVPEIPRPTETGSAGTQESASMTLVAPEPPRPLDGLPISQRVEGLAASRPRSMGGEVAAGLIAGSFTQLSHELSEARQQLKETQRDLHASQDALAGCRERSAVLDERVRASTRDRHLRNLCIAIGTALIGIAIEFVRNKLETTGYILGFLGALLLLFGWLSTSKGDQK